MKFVESARGPKMPRAAPASLSFHRSEVGKPTSSQASGRKVGAVGGNVSSHSLTIHCSLCSCV